MRSSAHGRFTTPFARSVPAAARRAVREFKQRIAPDAKRIKHALAGTALPLINDWAKKGSLGRERKLLRIREALAPARIDDAGGALLVMWLEPRGQMVMVDHPSFKQDCVLVVAGLGSRVRGSIRWASFPVVEAPDHALGRMHQRRPNIDLSAVLYQAAAVFLQADHRVVEAARLKGADACLPAGPGLLLCLPIAGPDLEGKMRLVARANTWIGSEMAELDQRPVVAAADPEGSVLAAVGRGG